MAFIATLKTMVGNIGKSTQLLAEIREGIAHLDETVRTTAEQQISHSGDARESNQLLAEIRAGVANLETAIRNSERPRGAVGAPPQTVAPQPGPTFVERASVEPAAITIPPIGPIESAPFDPNNTNPIDQILNSPIYARTTAFFAESPSARRALLSPQSQALLYSIIRQMKPAEVVEIGSFRVSTTEALARAVLANGSGRVTTIDPFGGESVPPLLAAWPDHLRSVVDFQPVGSMDFFGLAAIKQLKAGLIFIDGNHDYEFAMFDILSAARFITPGGLMVVDNIAQPGPYYAVVDFLEKHPDWRQWGKPLPEPRKTQPYDGNRTGIINTDFAILQAPRAVIVGARGMTGGYVSFTEATLSAVKLSLAEPARGTLRMQIIMRSFGERLSETILPQTAQIEHPAGPFEIKLDHSFSWTADPRSTAELWLAWDGAGYLKLNGAPELLA